MKSIQACLIFFLMTAGAAGVRAWDFPPSIEITQIRFNHGDYYDLAPTLKKNKGTSTITTPEWEYNPSTNQLIKNEKFAYPKNSMPRIKVEFYADPYDSETLTIQAYPIMGDSSWRVSGNVTFTSNYSGFEDFDTDANYHTYENVDKDIWVYFSWRAINNGVPYTFAYSEHYYFSLYDDPRSPMQEPWTEVLDFACDWVEGVTTESGVVSNITSGAYNSNFKNYSSSGTHCQTTSLNLTNLLTQDWADCRDMSAVVQIFSNALGVYSSNVKFRRIEGYFYTKSIDPIGNPTWQQIGWEFHQVGWYNSSVYDACIRIQDQSSPPVSRIPMGEELDGSYKSDLYYSGTWNPQTPSAVTVVE